MQSIIQRIRQTILAGVVLLENLNRVLPLKKERPRRDDDIARRLASRFGRIRAIDFDAMLRVKAGRPLVNTLLALVIPCGGKKNHSWLRILIHLLSHFSKIRKAQGAPGLVKYLKCAALVTQQVLAGQRLHNISPLGARLSRSGSGLPRCIPAGARKRLREGDYVLAKFLLTVFNMYRVIEFIGPVKTSTITAPSWAVPGFESTLDKYITGFTKLFAPGYKTFLSKMKLEPFPIFKSSPNCLGRKEDGLGSFSTHPFSLHRAAWALAANPGVFASWKRLSTLFGRGKSFVYPTLRICLMMKPDFVGGHMKGRIGKIGLKVEPAGKVRLFAMVDPWTQWLMNPLHKGIFDILRRHSMDGTFDQTGPLKRAFTWKSLHSLDLSAATDRLPISLQVNLLSKLIGRLPARDWKTVLVGRYYRLSYGPPENRVVKQLVYSVGQPMGALSSWAMLAYTHHFIVQCAAWEAKVTSRTSLFRDYAILGDDVVIGNSAVARHYLRIVKSLGVDCNLFKSITSPRGIGLEFAKRNIVRGFDISPVPIKEFWAALETIPNMVQFARKYKLSIPKALSVAGFGWRVVSQSERHLLKVSERVRNFRLSYFIPTDNASLKAFFSMRKTTQDWFVKGMDAFLLSEIHRLRVYVEPTRLYNNTRKWYRDLIKDLTDTIHFQIIEWAKKHGKPNSVKVLDTRTRLLELYSELWRFSTSGAQKRMDRRFLAYSNFIDRLDRVGGVPELLGYHGPLQMYSYFIQMSKDWLSLHPTLLFRLDWLKDPPKFGLDTRTTKMWKRWSGVFTGGGKGTKPPSHLEGGFILPSALLGRLFSRYGPGVIPRGAVRSTRFRRFLRLWRSIWLVRYTLRLLWVYRVLSIAISLFSLGVVGAGAMLGIDLSLIGLQAAWSIISSVMVSLILEFGRWTLVMPFVMYDQISLDLFLPHEDIGSPNIEERSSPAPGSSQGGNTALRLITAPALLLMGTVLVQVALESVGEVPVWRELWYVAGPRLVAQGIVLDRFEFVQVYISAVFDHIYGTFLEQVAAPWFVIMWLSATDPRYFIYAFPWEEARSWVETTAFAFHKLGWELFFLMPDPVQNYIWVMVSQALPDSAYWFIMEILF